MAVIEPALLAPGLRSCDLEAVRQWGRRVAWQARDAVQLSPVFRGAVGDRDVRIASVGRHFGSDRSGHGFGVEPHGWLRLGEVQATRGLAHFLEAGGPDVIAAFLRALAPSFPWPADLRGLRARAEVPSGAGRIDLLIAGTARGRSWGAVVEAKLEHDAERNPLADYAAFARGEGLVVRERGRPPGSGVLVILAKRSSRGIEARLRRNRRWEFVHWRALLRRFELELAGRGDAEFRRFRRTLWERVG